MARKKKEKIIHIGTIPAMTLFKAAQPWMGNQRGAAVYGSKNDYKRKSKHSKLENEE